jgi:photosystem II stability/assembly factor-like uncharacterized protein
MQIKIIAIISFLFKAWMLSAQYHWQLLPQSPQNGQKQDDVFFLNPALGWCVNGSGRIYKTVNGGANWIKILDQPGTYFRCITFRDSLHGFAGNIGPNYFPNVSDATPLYRTDDGGTSWQPVMTITGPAPTGLCALQVVTSDVVVAGGRVGGPTHWIRSTDGGATWTSKNLENQLAMVTDLYFSSPDTGFIFGGTNANIQLSKAKIIRTIDGGTTWTTVYESSRPFEVIWKAHFPTSSTGYATLLSYAPNTLERFVAKTNDGGLTWTDLPLVSNGAKAFGVGFLNENIGWVGCDNSLYETKDGGLTWTPENVGQYVNKIRVLDDLAFGIGVRIYKMTSPASANTEPIEDTPRLLAWPNPGTNSVRLSFQLESQALVTIQLLDSLGKLLLENPPMRKDAGTHTEVFETGALAAGPYFLLVKVDGQVLAQTTLIIQNKP